jgi:hypothetical protein
MAESGSHGQCSPAAYAERRTTDGWQRIALDDDSAFAFAKGERIVLGRTLVKRDGALVPIECDGDLRSPPEGRELVCSTFDGKRAAQTVTITRFDADADVIAGRTLPFAIRVPEKQPSSSGDFVGSDVVGFVPAGQVFSFEYWRGTDSHAIGTAHRCEAFVLDAKNEWQRLGELIYRTPDEWKCGSARDWNASNGWHIDPGRTRQDSSGEPKL